MPDQPTNPPATPTLSGINPPASQPVPPAELPPPPPPPPPTDKQPEPGNIQETPEIKPAANKKKGRVAAAIAGIALILISLPVALTLVKQRQEVRKMADNICNYPDNPQHKCNGHEPGWSTCDADGRWGCDQACNYIDLPDTWCDADTHQYTCSAGAVNPDPANSPCSGDLTPGPTSPPGTQCCSGTKDCAEGQQCMKTDDPNCSVCKPEPEPGKPGCCSGPNDCAHWESCSVDNGNCASGKSCGSHAGCVYDSDCASGKCQGGTCVGSGTLECQANKGGVKIINNTDQPISGTAVWFSRWCDHQNNDSCFCSGGDFSEAVTLTPDEVWTRGNTNSANGPPQYCAWQSDIRFDICHNSDHGCVEGCEAGQEYSLSCTSLAAFNEDWQPITNLNTISVGETIYFAVAGGCEEPQGITDARFRFNAGSWQIPTGKKSGKFYVQYEVPSSGSYTVEAMVKNPSLGWR